jgi:hypothetical protein
MKLVVWLFPSSVALTALMALTITPSRSQVNIKLGGGIGVMSPASDFSGSTLEYYNGSRYGLSSGRRELVFVMYSGGHSETVFLLE